MQGYHESVLLREVVEALGVKKDGWYLDCTLGDGGHSLEILRLGGKVVAIDVDPQAIDRAGERLKGFGEYRLIQGNFRDLKDLILEQTESKDQSRLNRDQKFKGVIFDLGVSSLQLEDPVRGFSFQKMGPLDMRMDPSLGIQALDLVNNLSEKELYELFNKFGEEKHSRSLAEALVFARSVKPISTTTDLAALVEKTVRRRDQKIPASRRQANASRGGHPATRVFQALRITVNDELNAFQEALEEVLDLVEKNGRILVISFHSLEDRIVKHKFRNWVDQDLGEIITKKPITPSLEEIGRNPRSRSAKLRIFEVA